jgi:hypothetical protein
MGHHNYWSLVQADICGIVKWLELLQVVSSARFNDEPDTLIWKYNSIGRYSIIFVWGDH